MKQSIVQNVHDHLQDLGITNFIFFRVFCRQSVNRETSIISCMFLTLGVTNE